MPSLQAYDSRLDYSYAPGIFPAMECLLNRPHLTRRLLVHSQSQNQQGIKKLLEMCEVNHIRVEEADRALARISHKDNCYAAAVFEKWGDTLDGARPHVVLHHPSDLGNVGTIMRTCLGFGIEDIAMIRPCADLFDPQTVRASMGAVFSLRLKLYDSFPDYLKEHEAHALYPFMLKGACPLEEAASHSPYAFSLIFGNEGSGLTDEFAQLGQSVRIMHRDKIDSLNLSIAAGIGIHAFMSSHLKKEALS